MKQTPHYWAVVLTHERINYGTILKEQPELLDKLKETIFRAAKDVIEEAWPEASSYAHEAIAKRVWQDCAARYAAKFQQIKQLATEMGNTNAAEISHEIIGICESV